MTMQHACWGTNPLHVTERNMQPEALTSGSASVSSLSVGPLMKPCACTTSAPLLLGSPGSACCAGVADGPELPAARRRVRVSECKDRATQYYYFRLLNLDDLLPGGGKAAGGRVGGVLV